MRKALAIMSFPSLLPPALAILYCVVCTSHAAILLDDTWSDESRDEQNLPFESQWFSSGGADALTSLFPGSLTFFPAPTSSRAAITYFATNGLPVTLADGQTILVTLHFRVTGVAANFDVTPQSMRFALVDYGAGTRVEADGGSSGLDGANVTGYGFFTHINSLFAREVLDIRERTGTTSSDLLGSGSAWDNGLADAYDLSLSGIMNETPYTMTFSVTRQGSDAVITNRLTGGGLDVEAVGTNSPGWFTFDAFAFRNSGADETAELFEFSRLTVEGPLGIANPPAVVAPPQDLALTVGQTANFNVAARGGLPLSYQWYFTTNGLTTALSDATNGNYSIDRVNFGSAGDYFVVVANSLGSATSAVATLTVNAPEPTPPGLVMDDTWADGDRLNTPVTSSNSVWYASSASSLLAVPNALLGNNITSSRLWLGYFTEDPLLPVDLAVGRAIKVTLVFSPTNVATFAGETERAVRIGLFNYADGGTRLSADSFSSSGGNGEQVRGYLLNLHFYSTFTVDAPLEIRARNDLGNANLIGTTSAYEELGEGPTGMTGAAGFASGVEYTLEFTVLRTGLNSVDITTRIVGGSLDISHTQSDSTYAYNRFDAFAIRVNRNTQAAEIFTFTRLKVEVTEPPMPFAITAAQFLTPDSFQLVWDSIPGQIYQVWSRADLGAGDWVTNATITATEASTAYTHSGVSAASQRFYQVINTPP